MTRLWSHLGGAAAAVALILPAYVEGQAQDQTARQAQAAQEIRGRIVRTAPDQFVVQTRDNRQVTFYTNPQTRYLSNNRTIPYSDLRTGSEINAAYATQGDRFIANSVTLMPAGNNAQPAQQPQPAPNQQVQNPNQGTQLEGQVVRVVGNDQVVIKTADNREVIVYVNPQTQYQFAGQPAQFQTLQPGYPVNVWYDVQGGRNMARRFLGARRR